jgi:predicted RNase H-like HicB family nuclease
MTARYTVLIEKGETGYGAYVPDLPGCVAVGKTVAQVERLIREAIELHLEAMLRDGDPVGEPTTESRQVEVDMAKLAANAERERAKAQS